MIGMRGMVASLRRRRAFLESRNSEEALSLLGGVCDRFSVGRHPPGTFFLTIRGVPVNGSAIVDVHSGAPIQLRADGSSGQYRLLLPLRRGCDMVVGNREVGCSPRRAAIASPDRDHAVLSEDGSERLWLTFDETTVTRIAGALLGEGLEHPVIFAPSVDLGRREIGDLFRAISFAAQQLADEASLFSSPWLRDELEEMIVTALLLAQPGSHSEHLAGPIPRVASRDVVRTVDYIHANLHAPVALADLVAAAGVPGRTLRQHFQHAYGLSPMAYVRKARYGKARELLLGEPGLSVTEAALRAGFDHLGRFAAGYRQRYGESPSHTVASRDRRNR